MNRKDFIKNAGLTSITLPFMQLNSLSKITSSLYKSEKMPLLFIGHGNPMNAILDNNFNKKWKELGKQLAKPQAILVISAHWLTHNTTKVTAMKTPKTIHDFGGFPKELFAQQYPAPGAPKFAESTINLIKSTKVNEDFEWGLDHGTWAVLKPMFPSAEIPVYQISIDYSKPASFHYQLGKELNALRNKGVLIIGSGNIVHNLAKVKHGIPEYDWAKEFDNTIANYINDRNFKAVVDFQKLGIIAKKSHPTYEHFLPLLYTLGATHKKENITYFNDSFDMGSIAMRSLLIN